MSVHSEVKGSFLFFILELCWTYFASSRQFAQVYNDLGPSLVKWKQFGILLEDQTMYSLLNYLLNVVPLQGTKTDPFVLHEPVMLITIIINTQMLFILEKSDWLSRTLVAPSHPPPLSFCPLHVLPVPLVSSVKGVCVY